jgi:hypothetical protein
MIITKEAKELLAKKSPEERAIEADKISKKEEK